MTRNQGFLAGAGAVCVVALGTIVGSLATGDGPSAATLAEAARKYAGDGELGKAVAGAWRVEAASLEKGSTVVAAQAAGQATFKTDKEARFAKQVQPHLAAILPEATSVKDTASRAKLVAALRTMADAADPGGIPAPRGPPEEDAFEPDRVQPDPIQPVTTPPSELFGWQDDTAQRMMMASSLPHRSLTDAAPQMVAEHTGKVVGDERKDAFLYKAFTEVLGGPPNYPAQQIGDCTSFGSGHAVDLLQCIDIVLSGGDKSQFRETSTEVIYGFGREVANMLGRGDGCYGTAVAKGLTQMGALPREKVGAYSGQRAKQYGRSGVPADFKALAAEFKLGAATLVTTTDEAEAALANGYPFIICSNVGFATPRNQDGVCEARGAWPHCMCVAGVRTKGSERQFLVLQSWGSSQPSGPTTDEQPPFSFWIHGKDLARVLRAQDSLAFSKFTGFTPRKIPDRWTYSGFAKPAPSSQQADDQAPSVPFVPRQPLKKAG
jgi:hypothetical protein